MRDHDIFTMILVGAASFTAGAVAVFSVCKRKEIEQEIASEFHDVHNRINRFEDVVKDVETKAVKAGKNLHEAIGKVGKGHDINL